MMETTRRRFMSGASAAAGSAAFGLVPSDADAQAAYPSQDIRFVCAFPPGSGADVIVRYFADKVRPLTGRNVVVENKAGANGNIAIEYVARAKPDGHTIYVHGASSVAASMSLFRNPPVNVGKAFQLAGTIHKQPFMLVVDPKLPYRTVADLTAAMKAKGAKATYATASSNGTVMGGLYKNAAGLEAVEVVYKNAIDSLNDQLSGSVDYGLHDPVYSLAQAREGRLRILGVSTGQRLAASPDLPTMTEQGVPMDLFGWWAAMVPADTPRPIVDQINQWFVAVVRTDETKTFLNNFGGDPLITSPDEAQAFFLKDIENWARYVEAAKITPQG